MRAFADRHRAWLKGLLALGLILFLPFLLLATPLAPLARLWRALLVLALFGTAFAAILGAMAGASLPVLVWVEGHLRGWIARFAADPEGLWLHWARHAHHPQAARKYLDQAVRLGGPEALFQEALVYLEGGWGAGGHSGGVERLRHAALKGHAEAAFRLADALRTGHGSVGPDPLEAERWYLRAAALGHGRAAAWLAHAYACGDGVEADEAKAAMWASEARSREPHPAPARSLLRHDAAPADPLLRFTAASVEGAEAAADRVVSHAAGRRILLLGVAALVVVSLGGLGWLFWVGSATFYHMPLIAATALVLVLVWQTRQLRKDRPRTGRDRLAEAAAGGDPEACYQLGLAHRRGEPHRPKDDLTAAIWFRRAAETGHAGAMQALAEAYLGGHGVLRDPREAARWTEAARRESTS
ncbi:tetratricopeptide repeat protein [Geothrix sp. PMB-07]|uniref:tetratricopeptide repeat protein n=1 Tax=Geothrix sp. PMB-07 TaxID=3068640 RepID=UPI0027427B0C|nr:hypothetical protein [Geothrix sp. PMB-07]WLT33556.1 hypothetical protein Q9293_03705 [Geothrix sp. PMB-07]